MAPKRKRERERTMQEIRIIFANREIKADLRKEKKSYEKKTHHRGSPPKEKASWHTRLRLPSYLKPSSPGTTGLKANGRGRGAEVSVYQAQSFSLGMDGGGRTTVWMYLMPPNCTLKDGYDGKACVR